VIASLLLVAATAAPPEAGPPTVRIPDEAIVLGLRRARIAAEAGDRNRATSLLDELVAAHPQDATALVAALGLHRSLDPSSEATRSLRTKLLEVLTQLEAAPPYPLLREIARDEHATDEELGQVVSAINALPGEGADRVARIRLKVEILDRLRRQVDLLPALEELAGLDPDPFVAVRLLGAYREAGRWDDVLRATAHLDAASPVVETSWWRIEALGALQRFDEMQREADALIDRLSSQSSPKSNLAPGAPTITSAGPGKSPTAIPPYLAERFFPAVFQLVDAGRREPAERLVAKLEAASDDDSGVKRIHVMLFGSPGDRAQYLAASAAASVASADPDKIRAEAYQRLIAKDYATARDLYRRILELPAGAASFDTGDWFNLGLASIETSAWGEAETAMTHVIAVSGASQARAYAHRARARIMQDRTADGMSDAEAALALDPKLKQACYAMYLGYEKLGAKEKAAEWLARSKAP